MNKITQVLIKNFGIILVLLLSFWAVRPLFAPGFFPIHDDTQVARVFEMGKMLSRGIFPVRWVPDLGYGYGYPIFNFYAPLAYYVGGILTLVGLDALIATKIMVISGVLLSGIFMYLLAKEFWGEIGGIISGLFYVYAPYHALDIYVRGDVAEFWAYAFVPLIFYGLYKIYNDYKLYKKSRWKWVVVGALGYTGVILSHNLTAMMVTPFLIIVTLLYCYIAYRKRNIHTTYYLILATVLGLILSAFYWVPALLELKYTNVLSQIGGGADFRDHFVCIQQLWSSPWGFGGSTKGCVDGMSFMIGKLHTIGLLIALALVFITMRNKNYNSYKYYILLAFAGFVISIFLTLGIAKPIWEAVPLMAFFQYPWRFLILSSFFSSFLAGFAIWFLKKVLRNNHSNTLVYYSTAIIVVFFLLFFNVKLFTPQTILSKTSDDYTNERALKWTTSKISDEFLPPNFKKPKSEYEIAKKPVPFKETAIEKISNAASIVGIIVLIIGIIVAGKGLIKNNKA